MRTRDSLAAVQWRVTHVPQRFTRRRWMRRWVGETWGPLRTMQWALKASYVRPLCALLGKPMRLGPRYFGIQATTTLIGAAARPWGRKVARSKSSKTNLPAVSPNTYAFKIVSPGSHLTAH